MYNSMWQQYMELSAIINVNVQFLQHLSKEIKHECSPCKLSRQIIGHRCTYPDIYVIIYLMHIALNLLWVSGPESTDSSNYSGEQPQDLKFKAKQKSLENVLVTRS